MVRIRTGRCRHKGLMATLLYAVLLTGCGGQGEAEGEGLALVGEPRTSQGLALDTQALAEPRGVLSNLAIETGPTPHQVVMPDGTPLPLRRWGPAPEAGEAPSAVVIGVHGFNDHAGSFLPTAAALVPDDVAVYAWDQRGFGASGERGRWPGTEQLLSDARWVIDQVRARYPDTPVHLVGLSMGGAIVGLLQASESPPSVASSVLVGPAFWGTQAMPWYQRAGLWIVKRLAPGLTLSARHLDVDPTDASAVKKQLASDPRRIWETRVDAMAGVSDLMDAALAAVPDLHGAPTFILIAGEDEVIPAPATCAMFKRLPPSQRWRTAYYPAGYHMLTRFSGSDTVLADVRRFLSDADAPLPSGAEVDRAEGLEQTCAGSS